MSSTNRGAKRREKDAYPTPSWCIESLIPEIVFLTGTRILKPCCGNGVIWRALEHVPWVDSIDWCEIDKGRDFLEWKFENERFDFIITNPPFSLAKEFIDKSLALANCVIMLLPQSFFGSLSRKEFWRQHPPTAQFILSKRPSFTGDGKTDSEVYSWVVWDSTGRQKKGWYWL